MLQLPDSLLEYLQGLPERYPAVERIVLFGSRSMGNAKRGSNVDLAFYGNDLTTSIISRIHQELEEETMFPYFFDVVHGDGLTHLPLVEQIQDHGSQIYPTTSEQA